MEVITAETALSAYNRSRPEIDQKRLKTDQACAEKLFTKCQEQIRREMHVSKCTLFVFRDSVSYETIRILREKLEALGFRIRASMRFGMRRKRHLVIKWNESKEPKP